ncbi:hypothetical protein GCM10010342_15250 [Streptomyces anulatus]|nr:hypothetical protein GCM10010342_15250 [Streptomyces anulatus]
MEVPFVKEDGVNGHETVDRGSGPPGPWDPGRGNAARRIHGSAFGWRRRVRRVTGRGQPEEAGDAMRRVER